LKEADGLPRHRDRHLERMTQPRAAELLRSSGTAVLAAGSVEQHGAHLPLGTDAYAALTVAERVAERLDTVVAPLGPLGVAHYHLPWGGTLTLEPSTLIAVVADVCVSLRSAGVGRVVIVNWHEGNSPTLRLAADQAQRRLDLRVVIAEAHVITSSLFPQEMEFTHAGSMETAAVLAHDPSLVRLEERTAGSDVDAGGAAHELFRRRDVYPVLRDFHQIAPDGGWYGHPEKAEPARAEEVFEAVAEHVVARVREIWAALEREAVR
jgi:creatinine amidohydrolase